MIMKKIPFSPPDIGELEINNVIKVLKSGWITTGPKTKEFENKISSYCGTAKTNCLNSATASMEMCLRLLGVGPGDEVITSAYTYTASASVIDHVGAKIILVDTDENSYHLSYEKLEKAIGPNTKVIIPVDIAGVMCDYDRIFKIIESKKAIFRANNEIQALFGRVIVLADAAHSFGAKYKGKFSGNVADFTSFSFHAVKNLTTSEGGALTWRSLSEDADENIYQRINTLSLHGQTKDALSKNQVGSWEYDVVSPAYKCNMTDIQAAIGIAQLNRYNDLLNKRRSLIELYKNNLNQNIQVIEHEDEQNSSSMHLLLTRVKNFNESERNEFITKLGTLGISTNVHYKPLPLLTAYKRMGFRILDYPHAFEQYINEVTLPLYTGLSYDDIDYICGNIDKILEGK